MAPPRIPGEDDEEIEIEVEGLSDEGDDVEAEGEGQDDSAADEGSDGDGSDGEEGRRQEAEGRRESRVLDRGQSQRETPLAKANRLAREAREEANRVSRELAEFRAEQQRARQTPQETPEQRNARYALMEPEARSEARLNDVLDQQNRQMAAMQARFADQTDKATFSSLAASNPLYKAVASEVETKLADLRRQGQNVDREALAKYLIGERVLKRGPKAAQQQRKAGQTNIQRQQARPSGGRSDQLSATAEQRRQADRARKLEDVTF